MSAATQEARLPVEPARPAFARWLGDTNEVTRRFLAAGGTPGLINMAGGLPDPSTYPAAEMAEIARRSIADNPAETLGYGPIEGSPALRDALARRFSADGLTLTRANVLVTTSGMQGLDLLGRALLEPGALIAAQFPTYLGALDAWRPHRPSYRPFSFDDSSVDMSATLKGAQFAYAVPNFSNPTGKLVGLALREKLVDAAHRTGTWLVEDDPYGGLHYDGAPPASLLALSARARGAGAYDGPVIHAGTLSKQIAPGLRIGWIIAAPEMIEALVMAKQGADMCTSGITQAIALAAIETGLVDRLQPRMVALYRARRDALCAALAEFAGDLFEWRTPEGGMFVWVSTRDPSIDTDALFAAAQDSGVCVAPSSVFDSAGRNRRALRINFTLNPPEKLGEGVRRLARALKTLPRDLRDV